MLPRDVNDPTEVCEPIGDLKAGLLLDLLLTRAGPAIYNQAIQDARVWIQTRAEDLDAELYEPEPDSPRR